MRHNGEFLFLIITRKNSGELALLVSSRQVRFADSLEVQQTCLRSLWTIEDQGLKVYIGFVLQVSCLRLPLAIAFVIFRTGSLLIQAPREFKSVSSNIQASFSQSNCNVVFGIFIIEDDHLAWCVGGAGRGV